MARLLILLSLLSSYLTAAPQENKNDLLYANLAGAAIITAWGITNWDYGQTDPHLGNEKWFERRTKSGGADKAGHLYAAYFAGSGLSKLYESWGYEATDAALYGSLSSFFLMNYMELGDAFSRQLGFSYEDMLMNTVGALSSYLFYTRPGLSKRIDLRIEYVPSFKTADFVTEYEKMKYLVAFKADGFDCITNPYLRYGELHVGYYTRNYQNGYTDASERILYLGIGINLSKVALENGYQKTGRFLNYYQLPYTYLPFDHDLNR